ncbi:MAG: fumarate hydratase [Deltaproteobacteria bacterium RBG_13_65_10]|jgi:fumarate hydratase subunit beta|nr:MAG: fumarate hydratase [Deltaproteobacteria bacterium RBG_13_65_10]
MSDQTKALKIKVPLLQEDVERLKAGDVVHLTGTVLTGRDAAHKRMYELLEKGESLPVDLKGQVIYYVGPSPAKPGQVIGSAGPTTSSRMDKYSPRLIAEGLTGMIGKGYRSDAVVDAMKKHRCVYFAAVGGAAALVARSIKKSEILAWEDLGTEAIRRMEVEDFPAIVVIDANGNDLYKIGREKYKKTA